MTLHLLSLMPVPDQISFNAGISACNKARKWQMVLYLLSQMTAARVVPNRISFSFNACISACEKAGEWQMTLHLLSLMPEAGVIPDRILFEAGIRACSKADEWQMALDLLSQMPAAGVDPDRQTLKLFDTAMRGRGRKKGAQPRQSLSKPSAKNKGGERQKAHSQKPESGVVPAELSFSGVMRACKKSGDWQMALDLLSQQMPAAGIVPNRKSFNAGMRDCKKGPWQMALYLALYLLDVRCRKPGLSASANTETC